MASIKEQLGTSLRHDGVDHVNVSIRGETELGKMASPDWRRKFFIPHVGDFISARSFANWLLSGGNEELRLSSKFYKTNVSLGEFRNLLLFGKYFQLYSMRQSLAGHEAALSLPWVMYKMHLSGVREMDRLVGYTDEVRDLVRDVMRQSGQNQSHTAREWTQQRPDILSNVNHYLRIIAGDNFIPFEDLDAVSRKRSAERARSSEELRKERARAPEQAASEVATEKPEPAPETEAVLQTTDNEAI